MSSGDKLLVFNPLERALSTDVNRSQYFAGAMTSELMRAMIDTGYGSDDLQASGLALQNTSVGTPAWAEIISGFMFQPAVGSGASVVQGGVLYLYDPDATPSADDSQYKYLLDPGSNSTLTPSLALTSNSSGQIRIDVIECSRVQPDTILEVDSRDVYVPASGTFTAVTVNKVSQAQLQYRIRTGTPGAGYPGAAADWLPLAIASVPTGTTTWDTVTLWDVRPMINDRVIAPFNTFRVNPNYVRLDLCSNLGTSGQFRVNGLAEVGLGSRRMGGVIQRGSPGTDNAGYIDLYDSSNQESGFVLNNTGSQPMAFLYLATMFNLPRWARYTDASASVRVPRSPRGIPVLSATGPKHWQGYSNAAITLPAIYGFNGASSTGAVCIGATWQTGTAGLVAFVGANRQQNTGAPLDINATTTTASATSTSLSENTAFPGGAKKIRVQCTLALSSPNSVFLPSWSLQLSTDATAGDGYNASGDGIFINKSGTVVTEFISPWMIVPTDFPGTTPEVYTISLNLGGSIDTGVTPVFTVTDWEF
jgi:hypothetical protein